MCEHLLADDSCILTNTACECNRIHPVHRRNISTDILRNTIAERIDCKTCCLVSVVHRFLKIAEVRAQAI